MRKFFLHLSRQEKRERPLSRLDEPEQHWKFSLDDLRERQKWDACMRAYEEATRHTATDCSPWYVEPADHKWFTRLVVAEVIVDALESLELSYPKGRPARRKELAAARTALRINKICPAGAFHRKPHPTPPAQMSCSLPGQSCRGIAYATIGDWPYGRAARKSCISWQAPGGCWRGSLVEQVGNGSYP